MPAVTRRARASGPGQHYGPAGNGGSAEARTAIRSCPAGRAVGVARVLLVAGGTWLSCVSSPHRIPTSPGLRRSSPQNPHGRNGIPRHKTARLSALRRACQGRGFADRRDAAILAVFEATGIRVAEMAGIRYDPGDPERCDLDLYGREIRVFGKGGKPRVVTVSYEAARSLDRYLRARAKHPLAGPPELWLGANGRGPLTGYRDLPARRQERGAGGGGGAPAAVPASFQPYLAGPGRRGRGPDAAERLVLPADAHLVRCQRCGRPRTRQLRPHHEQPAVTTPRPGPSAIPHAHAAGWRTGISVPVSSAPPGHGSEAISMFRRVRLYQRPGRRTITVRSRIP